MTIWMDMTYSMKVWQSGIVGIVRAELEMAKNLHECNKEIRFCKAGLKGFEEIKAESLEWLWNSDNTGDAYLEKMGRINKKEKISAKGNMPEGLEKAYSYSSGRLDRIERLFHMCIIRTPKLLRFLPIILASIARVPLKISSKLRLAYLEKKGNLIKEGEKDNSYYVESIPFQDGDLLFCAGWYAYEGIIKEKYISKIKDILPNLTVAYLVYDLVLSNENTQALYEGKFAFERYLTWIASNCDYIFYGGETAKRDAEIFFKRKKLPVRPGYALKFGSDVSKNIEVADIFVVRKKYNIEDKYILAVGTVDAKKNYTVVYRAYVMMKDMQKINIPQLVIVGGKHGDPNLSEMMETDPAVKGKIIFIRPEDNELVTLYKNSQFTVLPTWYEGWSLTLPESLSYGKFCLASDVDPLREIAGELIDYVAPDDAKKWAEKILYYCSNPQIVKNYEQKIASNFQVQTWKGCAIELNKHLTEINKTTKNYLDGHILYDLSLAFFSCINGSSVSGILRTQLILAKQLCCQMPHVRFLVFTSKKCIILDRFTLTDLIQDQSIEESVLKLQPVFTHILNTYVQDKKSKQQLNENYTNGEIYWMLTSLLPEKLREKAVRLGQRVRKGEIGEKYLGPMTYDIPLNSEDLFFSTGVGYSASIYKKLSTLKRQNGFKFIQLIYDFTPISHPQVHTPETREFYTMFLEQTYQLSDEVFYGGETAMRDGLTYQQEMQFAIRKGFPLKFGSDIAISNKQDGIKQKLWEKIGIKGRFIISVGTIEARKNHETLYLAYLAMMRTQKDLPQMIFCGYPGWKTQEFIKRLNRDERIKNKIILYTPTDAELDLLYRNCEFTVLASLYEGWSLTLPESLNYSKLCLCTDAAPLREIGGSMLEYVAAYDAIEWAETILKYYNNINLLVQKEKQIQNEWNPISWYDCSQQVIKELNRFCEEEGFKNDKKDINNWRDGVYR